jgi:hypothetical protein
MTSIPTALEIGLDAKSEQAHKVAIPPIFYCDAQPLAIAGPAILDRFRWKRNLKAIEARNVFYGKNYHAER